MGEAEPAGDVDQLPHQCHRRGRFQDVEHLVPGGLGGPAPRGRGRNPARSPPPAPAPVPRPGPSRTTRPPTTSRTLSGRVNRSRVRRPPTVRCRPGRWPRSPKGGAAPRSTKNGLPSVSRYTAWARPTPASSRAWPAEPPPGRTPPRRRRARPVSSRPTPPCRRRTPKRLPQGIGVRQLAVAVGGQDEQPLGPCSVAARWRSSARLPLSAHCRSSRTRTTGRCSETMASMPDPRGEQQVTLGVGVGGLRRGGVQGLRPTGRNQAGQLRTVRLRGERGAARRKRGSRSDPRASAKNWYGVARSSSQCPNSTHAPSSNAARAASATSVVLPRPASPETSRISRPPSAATRL